MNPATHTPPPRQAEAAHTARCRDVTTGTRRWGPAQPAGSGPAWPAEYGPPPWPDDSDDDWLLPDPSQALPGPVPDRPGPVSDRAGPVLGRPGAAVEPVAAEGVGGPDGGRAGDGDSDGAGGAQVGGG